MNREQAQEIADQNNLGEIYFEYRTAINTGKEFEVGYISREGHKELFCKRQSFTTPNDFYLCNEFRKLNGTE